MGLERAVVRLNCLDRAAPAREAHVSVRELWLQMCGLLLIDTLLRSGYGGLCKGAIAVSLWRVTLMLFGMLIG